MACKRRHQRKKGGGGDNIVRERRSFSGGFEGKSVGNLKRKLRTEEHGIAGESRT